MRSSKGISIILCALILTLFVSSFHPITANAEEPQTEQNTGAAETTETSESELTPQPPQTILDPVIFPVSSQKALKEPVNTLAADGKGTIIGISDKYVTITRDSGKKWEARSVPVSKDYPSEYQEIRYVSGIYYLTNSYTYFGEPHYYSTDGASWTPFFLYGPDGTTKLGIDNIQRVNGKWVMVASNRDLNDAYVYTSKDGKTWSRTGAIPDIMWMGSTIYIVPSGKGYAAIAGGYRYSPYKKTNQTNYFQINSEGNTGGHLIVYSSPDLAEWKLRYGAQDDKLRYEWYSLNFATREQEPVRDYWIYEEEPLEGGNIRFYDAYSNQLSSKDGITFTFNKAQPIFHKYSLADNRTPIFKLNNQYYVFTQYWYSPGVLRTRVLISKDRTNWKETKLKNALDNMYVIQSGKYFIGYNKTAMILSSDGLKWTKIR